MAVLPALPGVEISIIVDGEPLPEWDDPNTTSNQPLYTKVTKFVAGQPGKEFSIQFKANRDSADNLKGDATAFCFVVDLDDQDSGAKLLFKNRCPQTRVRHGVRMNARMTRRYVFQSLDSGPLEIKNEKSTGLGNWGTIRIIQTCVKVGEVLDSGDWSQNFHESRNFGVLEDKKNGGDSKSLQVALGQPDYRNSATVLQVFDVDGPNTVFEFKYRSKEDLMRMCIIPRPLALSERPLAELSQAEIDTLIEQNRENERRVGSVKMERVSPRQVKRERSPAIDRDADEVEFVSERPAKRRKSFPRAGDVVIMVD